MDCISDLEFFLILARHESIKNASLELGLTNSAVSQRLTALEDRLGICLANRTSRHFVLTDAGKRYAEQGKAVLKSFYRLEDQVRNMNTATTGEIRVNSSFGLGRKLVGPILSEFQKQYPNFNLELILTDKPQDLVRDRFDLCVWVGSGWAMPYVAKKLVENRQVFCASPKFLKKVNSIAALSDLAQTDAIGLVEDEDAHGIVRVSNAGCSKLVKLRRKLITNDGEVALQWCLDGLGVLMRSQWNIAPYLKNGTLQVVLPQWTRPAPIYAIYPNRHSLNQRTALLIDFLQKRLPLQPTFRSF